MTVLSANGAGGQEEAAVGAASYVAAVAEPLRVPAIGEHFEPKCSLKACSHELRVGAGVQGQQMMGKIWRPPQAEELAKACNWIEKRRPMRMTQLRSYTGRQTGGSRQRQLSQAGCKATAILSRGFLKVSWCLSLMAGHPA